MAYGKKENIEKIEEEIQKQKPTVLSKKRSSGSVDCSSSCVVIAAATTQGTPNSVSVINLDNGSDIIVTHPQLNTTYGNASLAKFGNRFWQQQPGNIIKVPG